MWNFFHSRWKTASPLALWEPAWQHKSEESEQQWWGRGTHTDSYTLKVISPRYSTSALLSRSKKVFLIIFFSLCIVRYLNSSYMHLYVKLDAERSHKIGEGVFASLALHCRGCGRIMGRAASSCAHTENLFHHRGSIFFLLHTINVSSHT